jgi:REP element-mobilizing transposase RayT
MLDHVHLLLTPLNQESGEPHPLSEIMRRMKGSSARRVNQASGSKGSVWQAEYFDRVLRSEESARSKAEYICQNPVRKGLATSPEEYPWIWREWVEGVERV